jgi:hypothetical protein
MAPTIAYQFTESTSTHIHNVSTALSFEEVNTVVLQLPKWTKGGLGSPKQEAVRLLLSTFYYSSSNQENIEWMSKYPALLSFPKEDTERSTANTIERAVRLKDDNGKDGYMASLEIFHQIHCLVSFFCKLKWKRRDVESVIGYDSEIHPFQLLRLQ